MGRRKLEMKRIEDKNSRQVTFSKRRSGLMKKAKELAVLCDVEVAVVIFSSRGKLYDFCSNNSLEKILQRYHSYMQNEGNGSTGIHEKEKQNSDCTSLQTIKELLQTVERDLQEPNVDQLNLPDLLHLEKQLEAALIRTRSRKTHLMLDSLMSLHEMEKSLREENKLLQKKIAAHTNNGMTDEMTMEFGNLAQNSRMMTGQRQITLELLQQ